MSIAASEQDENRPLLLLVDDTPFNLEVLRGILGERYRLRLALDGEQALEQALAEPRPKLILLDVTMPGMDGYEVCRRLKLNPATRQVPVIFVTALNDVEDEALGFEVGAVDYIVKPVSAPIVLARVMNHLRLSDQEQHLRDLVNERTAALDESRLQIIRRLGRAAEYKDDETGFHVIRMSYYARLLAQACGADEGWCNSLFHAAPMHDIGKIGIPDRILQKPGKLVEEEWDIMRRHPAIGARIIGEHDSEILMLAASVALSHHERWDGSGYPQGLSGDAIPLEGRIVALADVFDALTAARPYKPAWPIDQALSYIQAQAGLHFDPQLVPLFIGLLPEIEKIMQAYREGQAA
ncbi:HD-GYP domain-containing protein [Hydrocarboniphaga sp.]|uniref:HD-GYP domain-containing protein n=1 Tax=Hydrocarboniphaga sp. TaxID=2033016 RepID=UPI003D0F7E99